MWKGVFWCSVMFIYFVVMISVLPFIRPSNVKTVPDNLKFGVSTAAFQIEGAWNISDKGASIWDTFSHSSNYVKDGTKGDDTCKSYLYYKRDIQMLKYLGVQFYRFSISWPRLLPNGFANKISEAGKTYYNSIINELIENNIEPVITMYHWDLPQNIQNLGGWANPLIAVWFEDYARVLFNLFGDRVKRWVTINEPKQIGLFGYGYTRFAPGIGSQGIGDYMAIKNLIMAHAKAWRLYDNEFRNAQKGTCGITIATDFRGPASDSVDDIEAGLDAMEFEVGLYSHPIFSETGGFPKRVIRRVAEKSALQGYPRSRLPELSDEEKTFVKGTSDFYGFNHYSSRFYSRKNFRSGIFPVPSYDDDLGANFTLLHYKVNTAIAHCTSIPDGIRKALNWVKKSYNNPQIFITENGFGNLGGLHDHDRIKYFKDYLNEIMNSITIDGCNVTHYSAWSLMDNFEWASGLSVKFGLFQTDYQDEQRKRTARLSAVWYRNLIATRTLNPEYDPDFENVSF